ncbi:unnamed protein product [Blepharisma stoltei]|uniref:Uncharacterized protein n=1 Tax=Blepharisma stoltei TaxID=1481888 RepID=A0AAU9IW52_9CILI|nr:unnamed protein product [Blepharisma stoltei]
MMLPISLDTKNKISQHLGSTASSEPPPQSRSAVKFGKTIKVVKKIPQTLTMDDDFLLESEGDIRAFLKTSKPPAAINLRYNDKGKIVPYSIVGSPTLFESQTNAPKYSPPPTYSLPSSPLGYLKFGFPLVRKQLLKIDHEKKFKDKLIQINETHKNNRVKEKEMLRTMNLDQRLDVTKEQRALKLFQKTQEKWDQIDRGLCKRIKKPREDLLPSRAYEYREKLEELDIIDKVKSSEVPNKYHWYMSLREDPEFDKPEAFVNVGNYMTGLYTRIRESSNTCKSIIRKPGMLKTSYKTFRDDPYFKDTVKNDEIFSNLSFVRSIKSEDLNVVGLSKLPLEIDAVKSAGIEYVKFDAVEKGGDEEVIIENHMPKIRAYTSKTTLKSWNSLSKF